MPKPKKDPIQQALRELLTDKEIQKLFTIKTIKTSPELSAAIKKGEIPILCQQLHINSTNLFVPALYRLLGKLLFLVNNIEDDTGRYRYGPTQEWLWKSADSYISLPVGTAAAARQALVELLRVWVEGLVKGYTVQPIPQKPTVKRSKPRGPKDKVDSWNVYGAVGVRPFLFYDMLEALEAYKKPTKGASKAKFAEEEFKKGSDEKSAAFEDRTIKLVQRVHQEFGWNSKYFKSERFGDPPKILHLPPSKAKTIAQQAIVKSQKWINPRNLLYGLLAEYERNDPTEFIKIRQLITRNV